ncbi:MAG TPA: hypothetical protein VES42_02435 [Pilimelia sp.]|nr:hypothetical protein [Pilimelia sp.]
MIRQSARVALVATAVLLLAVAGCTRDATSTGETPVPTTGSTELFDKIIGLQEKKESATLRSLTDFAWDAVFCYYEGTPHDEINADVGSAVEKPGRRLAVSGALAVFVDQGRAVRRLTIPELVFTKGRHSADVVVEGGHALVEPGRAASPSPS